MKITKIQNLPGLMILVDFEKAYDSLEWNFLFKALKKCNFGDSFIKWVRLLYTNISSCIMKHGTTTSYFHLQRGTRQGVPLSGYLFYIALELLSEAL